MGSILLCGGIIGSFIGIKLFVFLKNIGQIDTFISVSYVILLGSIGSLTLIEGLRSLLIKKYNLKISKKKKVDRNWIYLLPFRLRFRKSGLYISIIPPVLIGMVVGVLATIMGVGGGFIMVPAMIYILRMPTNVVIGTSLYQIVFVTSLVTILHSYQNQTVDIILAIILMIGGVIGVQIGAHYGHKLKGEQLRALLGVIILLVCFKMAYDLALKPDDLFSTINIK
jgi:uncharacterized membrane protein YfcA